MSSTPALSNLNPETEIYPFLTMEQIARIKPFAGFLVLRDTRFCIVPAIWGSRSFSCYPHASKSCSRTEKVSGRSRSCTPECLRVRRP